MRDLQGRFQRHNLVDDCYFSTLDERRAWMLGLLASDGCISGNKITLSQSSDYGLEMMRHCQKEFGHTGRLYATNLDVGATVYTMYFTSEPIARCLRELGLSERKSLVLEYPELPETLNSAFIRGYFEGDGSIGSYKVGGSIDYLVISIYGTKAFISKLREIVPIKSSYSERETGAEARWFGKNAYLFGAWLFASPELYESRKVRHFLDAVARRNDKESKYAPIRQQAKTMLEQGVPVSAIAQELKLPFQTIYKWRKRHGW